MSIFYILVGPIGGSLVYYFIKSNVQTYKGEISDHFDGKKFSNMGGEGLGNIKALLKHNFTNKKARWAFQNESANHKSKISNFNVSGEVRYYHINHASILIQIDGINILTDPVYMKRASPFKSIGPKRFRKPGIPLEFLPKIDLVVLSHDHFDHLDIDALQKLQKRDNSLMYVGLGLKAYLKKFDLSNVEEMDWHQTINFESLDITFTPTIHWSNRGFSPRKTLWGGFMIKGSVNVYFVGDTAYGKYLKDIKEQYGRIDLAFVPIGAYIPRDFMLHVHMDPDQATQAHLDLEADESYAIHWGTFQLTHEGMFDPIDELKVACAEKGINNFYYDLIAGTERIYKKT